MIWPLSARAQKTARIPRIGVLWHAGSAEEEGRYFTGFIEGLRDLGYSDGLNIILEHRFPNEMPDRFRKMAAELVSMNVDVLVSVGSQTAFYAKDATTTIPAMVKAGMQAVTINSEGLAYQQRELIANLAIARGLPLSVWSRETLEAGALMSYGADQPAMCRRAAIFVDRILKGAKPADLPVEEPTKIEFLINKKTAKALGLTFPNTLLVAATYVIE